MKQREMRSGRRWARAYLEAIVITSFIAIIVSGAVSAPAVAATQRVYATPEQAVSALVAAVQGGDASELQMILGPGSKTLISSGDAVADAQARRKFIAEYETRHQIETDDEGRVVLAVGTDDWPFPFPLVKDGSSWQFDAAAGAEEIVARRIGANELFTIQVCHAYVDAQREYAEQDRNHDGFLEYAQKFLSSPGKQDGLYWPTSAGEEESPIGPLMARARAEGYSTVHKAEPRAFHGYYYRILKGQGAAARGGAYDYLANGHMIGGFAMVAFPAQYGVSGVMTFIVNHDGVVYQKDLGPRTGELARKMTLFDPDPSWKAL